MPGRSRGPVPKRSDQRRRMNKPAEGAVTRVSASAEVPEAPEVGVDWHPIAREWYESLSASGQAQFYEPSDWATARYIAEAMSRNLSAGRFSGQLFASVLAGMTELLTTEGARRRARIELERASGEAEPPKVAIMASYRDQLKRAGDGA